jgi:hypothetical protein
MKLKHEQHCNATSIEFELNLNLIEKNFKNWIKIGFN